MLHTRLPRLLLAALALGAFLPAGALAESVPSTVASAAAITLKVGDAAPTLKPQKWLQGEPVTDWEKDKTYIVECWATWCGPCVAAIPHVNALHNKFKDKGLIIIGMNVWEDDITKPVEFLKKRGDGMAYRVAFDGGQSGDTANNWLKATGAKGIPHAFVVREGKIFWQGHPAKLGDAVVESMLTGTFDAKEQERKRVANEAEQEARLKNVGDAIREARALSKNRKFDEALAKLASVEKDAGLYESRMIRIDRAQILVSKGDAGAVKNLITIANNNPDDLALQHFAADLLLNAPELKDQRDPKAAKTCTARMIAGIAKPTHPLHDQADFLLLDAQADYAVGDKDAAEKNLTALMSATTRSATRERGKIRAALEAVKAGKAWPAESVPK